MLDSQRYMARINEVTEERRAVGAETDDYKRLSTQIKDLEDLERHAKDREREASRLADETRAYTPDDVFFAAVGPPEWRRYGAWPSGPSSASTCGQRSMSVTSAARSASCVPRSWARKTGKGISPWRRC